MRRLYGVVPLHRFACLVNLKGAQIKNDLVSTIPSQSKSPMGGASAVVLANSPRISGHNRQTLGTIMAYFDEVLIYETMV